MSMRRMASVAAGALWVSVGLGSALAGRNVPRAAHFRLTSPAFADAGNIPTRFSCADPSAVSLPLKWSDPPAGTKSFALIMHDTDTAPNKDSMDVTHWIVWNVPASARSIPADIKPGASPDGMRQGKNFHAVAGYLPVCPPPGWYRHHYVIELFALDTMLSLPAGSTRAELLNAMNGHIIGKSAYFGRFGR